MKISLDSGTGADSGAVTGTGVDSDLPESLHTLDAEMFQSEKKSGPS